MTKPSKRKTEMEKQNLFFLRLNGIAPSLPSPIKKGR